MLIYKVKGPNYIDFSSVQLNVQVMNEGKVVRSKTVKGWKAARCEGAKMLKRCKIETAYIRIYDINDVTNIDFITRSSMKTRVYDKGEKKMSEEVENKVPTKAQTIKDIDAIIKENQVQLVVEITEHSAYSSLAIALLTDIEHFKRIKVALK